MRQEVENLTQQLESVNSHKLHSSEGLDMGDSFHNPLPNHSLVRNQWNVERKYERDDDDLTLRTKLPNCNGSMSGQ